VGLYCIEYAYTVDRIFLYCGRDILVLHIIYAYTVYNACLYFVQDIAPSVKYAYTVYNISLHRILSHTHSSDSVNELELVKKIAKSSGAFNAVICSHWAEGGAGAAELASAVIEATAQPSEFKFLYPLDVSTMAMTCNLYTLEFITTGS